jgi:hypothetical protein
MIITAERMKLGSKSVADIQKTETKIKSELASRMTDHLNIAQRRGTITEEDFKYATTNLTNIVNRAYAIIIKTKKNQVTGVSSEPRLDSVSSPGTTPTHQLDSPVQTRGSGLMDSINTTSAAPTATTGSTPVINNTNINVNNSNSNTSIVTSPVDDGMQRMNQFAI